MTNLSRIRHGESSRGNVRTATASRSSRTLLSQSRRNSIWVQGSTFAKPKSSGIAGGKKSCVDWSMKSPPLTMGCSVGSWSISRNSNDAINAVFSSLLLSPPFTARPSRAHATSGWSHWSAPPSHLLPSTRNEYSPTPRGGWSWMQPPEYGRQSLFDQGITEARWKLSKRPINLIADGRSDLGSRARFNRLRAGRLWTS